MAKKTKQPTIKEQVYRSIANSHVQQATQNNGVAQLQAEYDTWKNQQGVQNLQSEYDNWLKAQAPAQSATVSTKVESPKKEQTKFATAAERRAMKESQQIHKNVSFDPEQSYYNRFGKGAKEKIGNTIGKSVNQIPGIGDYYDSLKKESGNQKSQVVSNSISPKNDKNTLHIAPRKEMLDALSQQALASNPLTRNSNYKKDAEITIGGENNVSADNGLKYTDNDFSVSADAIEKEHFKELANSLKKTYKDSGVLTGAPISYPALKLRKNNPYNSLSDEDKQLVRDYITENKDNPNLSEADKETLRAFSVLYNMSGEEGIDTSGSWNNSTPEKEQKAKAFGSSFVNFNAPFAKAIGKALVNSPLSNLIPGLKEEIEKEGGLEKSYDDLHSLSEDERQKYPGYSEAGRASGQMYDYLLTSQFINGIGEAANLGKNATVALNQGVQGAQDLFLDILPEAQRMLKEEGKIDWGSLAARFGEDVVANFAMDAVPFLAGANYDYLAKTVGNNADIFKTMDASGAVKNAPDAIRAIDDAVQNSVKATDVPGLNTADDITEATNKQFSALMDQYNGEFKDESAMKNIFTPEDLEASQNSQFSALMKQRPQNIPQPELPVAKTVSEAPSVAKSMEPSDAIKTGGFSPLQEEIESDFRVLAEPMNKLSTTGYMDNITDVNALKKWNALNEAYDNYLNKAIFGGTYDEINAARKKMESTRKAFARTMENIDPEVAKMFNTSEYGKAVGRPAYKALGTEKTPEQIEDGFRAILEAEGYAPEQIETMVKNADVRGNMDMNLQRFGGKNANEPEWKVSQAYTNTGKNGGGWTEAEYNKYTDPKYYLYETKAEQQSVEEATRMRATEGREAFKKRVMASERLSSVEIDGLMMEWRELTQEARALEEAGKDADKLWWESNKIFRTIQEQSTDNAQALQALAKWSRNTPEGMLVNAENIINGKVKTKESALQAELRKIIKNKKVKVEFTPEFEKEFLKTAEPLDGLTGTELDTREAKEIMAKLGRMVNEQIPVKLPEKLTTWLMDNMLGNFRTLISRNAGGNIGLNAMEQVAQKPLAAGIDKLVSLKTGKRTQAGLSLQGLSEYFQGFKKGLADELADVKTGLHTARSGENTLENAISSNRRIFQSKLLNLKDQLVRHGLSIGDRPFYESVYKQTLGDYHRLYDKGLMGDTIQNLKPKEFEEYAEVAAHLNALGAVYQQDSLFSKALLGFKKDIGMLSEGALGVDILSQFSMPFVKTPANVIERAIDYSPLGIVRNGLRTGRELKAGALDQNRFVNEAARNILGTGLMAGGVGLAAKGTLSGSYSDDPDAKQAQKESGMQQYAWNIPEQIPGLGGKQMDISWVPILGSNLVASASAYDAYNKGEGDLVGNLSTGVAAGGEALFDQSMFQGLQRLFGSDNSYDSDKGIMANVGKTVKSGLGQFVPSYVRQVAQVSDQYQRDTSNSNKDVSFGPMSNYDLNSLANNIPGLRQEVMAPKVDTQGNLVEENQGRGVLSKIVEDMILPGKLTEIKTNPLAEEAQRLSELNNSDKAYLPKADRKAVDQEASEESEGHILTNDEWVDYQQKYYRALDEAGNMIINSDYYNSLDSVEQEKMLSNAYSDIKSAINSEYTGKELNGAAKVYKEAGGGEKGANAVMKYYVSKNYIDQAGTTRNSKTGESIQAAIGRNDYAAAEKIADKEKRYGEACEAAGIKKSDAAREAFDKGGTDGLRNYAKYKTTLDKYGMSNTESNRKLLDEYGESGLQQLGSFKSYGDNQKKAYGVYQNAKSVIPGLSVSQFKTQYDKIDGSGDKGKDDGSVTQGEMISFLNAGNYSEAEATKYWNAYGNAWKATLYKTKKGKWAYKTK